MGQDHARMSPAARLDVIDRIPTLGADRPVRRHLSFNDASRTAFAPLNASIVTLHLTLITPLIAATDSTTVDDLAHVNLLPRHYRTR